MTWVQEIEGKLGEMNNRFEACLLSWCLNYVLELNAFCSYAGSKQMSLVLLQIYLIILYKFLTSLLTKNVAKNRKY